MRAKSIKNTARVNAELSPAELKGLLKKVQSTNASYQTYIAALEAELSSWRSGGSVPASEWATPDKVSSIPAGKKAPASVPSTPARSMTPSNPALDNLRGDFDSRPQTPTVVGLDKDEREEFLKRENELSDSLAERETALKAAEKQLKEIREELTFLKDQEATVSKVCPSCYTVRYSHQSVLQENKSMSTQLSEFRLQVERLGYDNKESAITIDILKEQNQDANNQLEELRKAIVDLKASQKDAQADDKERKKQEKMALMMAKFDSVRTRYV